MSERTGRNETHGRFSREGGVVTGRSGLLVVGGTPGGVAAAVVAARRGLDVVLTERGPRLGGLLTGGLGVMDTQYDGPRASFYDELCARLLGHYRDAYGEDSEQYRNAVPRPHWPLTAEPHVAEEVIESLVAAEPRIEVVRGHVPVAVLRSGRRLLGVQLAPWDGEAVGEPDRLVRAGCYVDATYEGDLFALAGEDFQVGRENRRTYGEPHAGRIFTRRELTEDGSGRWPREAAAGRLATRTFKAVSTEIFAGSTGEGDALVQAYSYRLCLSRDPGNRRMPDRPEGYDPEVYRRVAAPGRIGAPNLPNGKRFWFRNLTGPQHAYPRASEPERQRIREIYRRHALGFLYFLQHDPSVPEQTRREAAEWGLARDEFTGNGNFPYELYVREARRLAGRYVFTEHDASLAPGIDRTPVHSDAVAVAEWFMDSHEVSDEHRTGSSGDGKILLTELTRPSQIPYRVLLPTGLDDLLVAVCVSASHVGWGTLRLEPVWAHLGEVAGRAAALAAEDGVPVAEVDTSALQRELAEAGGMLTFLNDVPARAGDPAAAAAHLLGAQGFFAGYTARLDQALDAALARVWANAAVAVRAGVNDAMATARRVAAAEADPGDPVTGPEFAELLRCCAVAGGVPADFPVPDPRPSPLTRARAVCLLSSYVHSGRRTACAEDPRRRS
jgi:hypothetical protein